MDQEVIHQQDQHRTRERGRCYEEKTKKVAVTTPPQTRKMSIDNVMNNSTEVNNTVETKMENTAVIDTETKFLRWLNMFPLGEDTTMARQGIILSSETEPREGTMEITIDHKV